MGMSEEIRANYEQIDLLPQSLEDWVPADHPARFIRAFVDALDLAALGFRERQSEEGRPPYANDLLLKVWLYGYLARIRATRELERACREHLSLLWLTGRHTPDHNTLWRFFRENRRALREVFRAGVRVAAEQGLIGMVGHAVDGTKIRAVASGRTMEKRKDLEKALAQVEKSIVEMEAAIEKAEQEEAGEYRLPERLQKAEELRQAIRESLGKMQEIERDRRHPHEPEVRVMKCEGRKDPAYNAQAVADAQAGIIVAATAVNAETDHEQLVPMLEEVRANLGRGAEETVGDGQYATVQQLTEAEARGYAVLTAPGSERGAEQRGEYAAANFSYDAEHDEVICPRGARLKFRGMRKKRGARAAVRAYYCPVHRSCPVRELCSRSQEGRRIELSPQRAARERQRAKRDTPRGRALLRQRKVIIEPVFAAIKQGMGFRRWTVRGLENVRTQWALLCTVFNLKKLYPHWRKTAWAAA
jgi:transposase